MKCRLVAAFCLAVFGSSAAGAQPGDLLIVPGRQIGRVHLGPDGDRTLAALPEPDVAGQVWARPEETEQLWMSHAPPRRHDTLYVHTTANSLLNVKPHGGVTIDLIRVTSPRFATREGLHAGSTLAQIRRRFPDARPGDSRLFLYDEEHTGIAFEFARPPLSNSRAIAVMIHPPGDPHLVTAQQVNRIPDGG